MDQVISSIESKRRSAKNAKDFEVALYYISFPCSFILLFIMLFSKAAIIGVGVFYLAFLALLIFQNNWCKRKQKEYRETLEEGYLKPYFFDRYNGMQYEQDGFTKDEVKGFSVFSNDNLCRMFTFKARDQIKNMYRGVPFEESYVSTDLKYDFMGRTFSISYPALSHIDSVRISTRSFMFRSIPSLGAKYQTGNEEFDSMFNVTAANYRDAESILTPEFMRELIGFRTQFPIVSIHIRRGMVYVAIGKSPNEIDDLFENPLDEYRIMQAADSYVNTTSHILNGVLYILSLTQK